MGVMTEDFYAILEIPYDAQREAIQSSYRRLALQFHPDRNPPDRQKWAEEQMKRLNAAYAVLSDRGRREEYDRRQGRRPRVSQRGAGPGEYVPFTSPISNTRVRSKYADDLLERRKNSPYPPETENDWFFLHIYAQGRGVPEVEQRATQEAEEALREFLRLAAPPGNRDAAFVERLYTAGIARYGTYGRYEQFVARLTLRTLLPALRKAAEERPDVEVFRALVMHTNDLMQNRMGTEGLRMIEKGKNIVTDWAGRLLATVDFLWGAGD